MNLTARALSSDGPAVSIKSVSLTLRPSCSLPGDFSFITDSPSLLRMLRQKTELRSSALESFEKELLTLKSARLSAVEMSEKALTEIGYFVD